MRGLRTVCWLLAVLVPFAATPGLAQTPPDPSASTSPSEIPDGFFDELEYRFVGPLGNRVIAVTGEPGNPNVYYVGAASGGIFKTTDGGAHCEPVFRWSSSLTRTR